MGLFTGTFIRPEEVYDWDVASTAKRIGLAAWYTIRLLLYIIGFSILAAIAIAGVGVVAIIVFGPLYWIIHGGFLFFEDHSLSDLNFNGDQLLGATFLLPATYGVVWFATQLTKDYIANWKWKYKNSVFYLLGLSLCCWIGFALPHIRKADADVAEGMRALYSLITVLPVMLGIRRGLKSKYIEELPSARGGNDW